MALLTLLAMIFSSGLQMGFNANLFLRRSVTALAVNPGSPPTGTWRTILHLEVFPGAPTHAGVCGVRLPKLPVGIRSNSLRCAAGVPLRSKKNEPKRIKRYLRLDHALSLQ